jgi:hypothetical protein
MVDPILTAELELQKKKSKKLDLQIELFLEELFGNHNPIGMLTEKDETPCQRRSQSAHILLFHKILK